MVKMIKNCNSYFKYKGITVKCELKYGHSKFHINNMRNDRRFPTFIWSVKND